MRHLRTFLIMALATLLVTPTSFAQDNPEATPPEQAAPPEGEATEKTPEADAPKEEAPEEALDEDLDEEELAARHFAKGRELYVEGQYLESIAELLKAYELRPAPPILLNIARTYEKLDDKKNALKYYKEFLLKARMNDPNRPQVEGVVKKMEKEVGEETGAVTSAAGTDTPEAALTVGEQVAPRQGRGRQQLIHTPVDSAKVDQPITIMAELPPMVEADKVVVFFRKTGETDFREREMELQGEAYVTRIPARFITATSLQYYIEAIKGSGKNAVVAATGKKNTPHIIVIEGGRAPILGPIKEVEIRSPYRTWFWAGVATTTALVGGTVAFTLLARDRESAMERWVDEKSCDAACQAGGGSPKQPFNVKARDWESEGQNFATLGKVFLVAGVLAAGATGYLWYKDRKYVEEERLRRSASGGKLRFLASPWATDNAAGFVGSINF